MIMNLRFDILAEKTQKSKNIKIKEKIKNKNWYGNIEYIKAWAIIFPHKSCLLLT